MGFPDERVNAPIAVALTEILAGVRYRRGVIAVCMCLATVSIFLLPFASLPLAPLPLFVPIYTSALLITDLTTAFLLFNQFYASRNPPLLVLAAAYLFTGMIVVPHLLAFPDIAIGGRLLIGTDRTTAWMWMSWHIGYPLCVLGYVAAICVFRDRVITEGYQISAIIVTIGVTLGLVTVLTVLGTGWWYDIAPPLMSGNRLSMVGYSFGTAVVVLTASAFVAIWVVTRGQSVLHLWLAAALVAFFFDFILNILSGSRYTLGWYFGRTMGVVSSSFLLLLFLGEITGLYRKLAYALRELTISNLRLEQRVAERTQELQTANQDLRNALTTKDKALAERDILLREVYHRVKNNLQVIDTLVMLQASLLPDAWAEKVLELRPRVKALGLVHQQLMESKDLATFSAMGFFDDLCRSLATAFAAQDCGITLRVEAEPVPVDLDVAIPLGLLVTELVSNAFKHAFPDHQGGEIVVCFSCQPPGMARLVVADTGCGISEMVPDGNVGSQIIEALVTQIEGEKLVRVLNGTSVEITFPYSRGSLNDR